MQLHDFAREIFVQAALAVHAGARIRAERLLVVEKEQHRRMLLDRLQHVGEAAEHIAAGSPRARTSRPTSAPARPCWRRCRNDWTRTPPAARQSRNRPCMARCMPRQRLGAKGFLDDVQRLRRRFCALGCIGLAAAAASPHLCGRIAAAAGCIAGSFGAISIAMLLSDRLRRCGCFASGAACDGASPLPVPAASRRHRAPAGSRTDSRTPPCPAPASTQARALRAARRSDAPVPP